MLPGAVCAQKKGQPLIDSILGGLKTQQEDSGKVKALAKLSETWLQINPAEGIGYAQAGVRLSENSNGSGASRGWRMYWAY